MFVQLAFHMRGINVRRVFDWDFNRLKPPFLKSREKLRAFVGKRRSEQKGVDSKSHKDLRLIKRYSLSKAFRWFWGNCGSFSSVLGRRIASFLRLKAEIKTGLSTTTRVII